MRKLLSLVILLAAAATGSAQVQGVNYPAKKMFPYIGTPGMRMYFVPGGTFTMGATAEQQGAEYDETPTRVVEVEDLYVCETEITQEQWEKVGGDNAVRNLWTSEQGLGDKYPVYGLSYEQALEFVNKMNDFTNNTHPFRLPTEAEWEYIARGGQSATGTRYSGSDAIVDVAWYVETSQGAAAQEVKKLMPNSLGLYDMSGNVSEMCDSWYEPCNNAVSDPKTALGIVTRGGSYASNPEQCRTAYRGFYLPGGKGEKTVGIRLVISAKDILPGFEGYYAEE